MIQGPVRRRVGNGVSLSNRSNCCRLWLPIGSAFIRSVNSGKIDRLVEWLTENHQSSSFFVSRVA